MHFNLISSSGSFLRSVGNMAFSGPVPGRILVTIDRGFGIVVYFSAKILHICTCIEDVT